MALSDYMVRTETIPLPGGKSFDVRAISLEDIMIILHNKRDRVKKLFDDAENSGLTREPNMAQITGFLVKEAPDLLGEIIACSAGEPDMAGVAAKLPISSQVHALSAIVELTFESEGGLKKFGENVVRLLEQANSVMTEVNTQSKNSSADFIGNAQS